MGYQIVQLFDRPFAVPDLELPSYLLWKTTQQHATLTWSVVEVRNAHSDRRIFSSLKRDIGRLPKDGALEKVSEQDTTFALLFLLLYSPEKGDTRVSLLTTTPSVTATKFDRTTPSNTQPLTHASDDTIGIDRTCCGATVG